MVCTWSPSPRQPVWSVCRCHYCKQLAPEYEKAAQILSQSDPPIHLARLDCYYDSHGPCTQYSVKGFPTMGLFRGRRFIEAYVGHRTAGVWFQQLPAPHPIIHPIVLVSHPVHPQQRGLQHIKKQAGQTSKGVPYTLTWLNLPHALSHALLPLPQGARSRRKGSELACS